MKTKDYKTLVLSLPGKPAATHYLYLRRHTPRVPTPADARTLFAANIPVDATPASLRSLFSALGGGRVESVDFCPSSIPPPLPPAAATTTTTTPTAPSAKRKRGSGGGEEKEEEEEKEGAVGGLGIAGLGLQLHPTGATATITFVDAASSSSTLRRIPTTATATPSPWSPPAAAAAAAAALGIPRYTSRHRARFPSSSALQEEVDSFMASFSHSEAEAARKKRKAATVDADGFVTVVRGPKAQKATTDGGEKEKEGGLKGFYRFQAREERKRRQVELVAAFEEDRKRVEERKLGRKFRPEE